MSDENNEGKLIVFNPSGFILKLIFSIGMTVLMISMMKDSTLKDSSLLQTVFLTLCYFVIFWFAASMFGFCLRATGNYIIALILMFILLALLCAGITWLGDKNKIIGNIAGIVFILFLIWLPVNDVRKAILYFKNTV